VTKEQDAHTRAIEAAYRRGYHHGFSKALDLIFGLLESGMPTRAVTDLCHVFQQYVVLPWRSADVQQSSVPPQFDLETCQGFVRESKRHQRT